MNGRAAPAGSLSALLVPGEEWSALKARALDPAAAAGPLPRIIATFGGAWFTGLLAEPASAQSHHLPVPEAFVHLCRRHGIPAETVTAVLRVRVPPFQQEPVLCGHTAVQVSALAGHRLCTGEIIIDWTARRFDPVAPVPLVVAAANWRAFWRDLHNRLQQEASPGPP